MTPLLAQKIDRVVEIAVVQPSVPVLALTRFCSCASMRSKAWSGTSPLRSATWVCTTEGSATSPQIAISAAMPGNSASMVKKPQPAAIRPRLRSSMVCMTAMLARHHLEAAPRALALARRRREGLRSVTPRRPAPASTPSGGGVTAGARRGGAGSMSGEAA